MRNSIAGIVTEDGKIFIARRKIGGGFGGMWEFPGGKVEKGETDEAALEREYAEEFGVRVRVGAFLGSAEFTHREELFTVRAYKVFFIDRAFVLCEHTEIRWVTPDELNELAHPETFVPSDILLKKAVFDAPCA